MSRQGSAETGGSGAADAAVPVGPKSEAEKAMEPQKIGPLLEHGGCELRIVNVTATANVGCTLDLQRVVMRARNAEYNPKRFSACVSLVNLFSLSSYAGVLYLMGVLFYSLYIGPAAGPG